MTLTYRGVGDPFLQWIAALYSDPSAIVKYMGHESSSFPIAQGVCQGCPLSPLLFVIALEPLAAHMRRSSDIGGIELAGVQHKLAMFADDILMLITSPHITLPNLVTLLDNFSFLSGPYVNQAKFRVLNISLMDNVLLSFCGI